MSEQLAQFDHWVTIDDHHVLIKGGSDNEPSPLHHLNESGLHQKLMSGEEKPRQGDFVKAKLGTFSGFVKSEKTVAVGKKGSITGNMVAGPNGKETFLPHSEMQFVAPREYDEGVKFSPEFEHPNPKKARSTFSTEGETLQLAQFDLNGDLEETADYVIVKGKIFEAGRFEDKQFEISPEELAAATEGFKPVPVDYSHVEGPLDGKLGELRSVSLSENGKDLMGEVAIPKWLDKALGDTARKVSCTWNRATKRLEKLALVNTPRIQDAILFAAFIADQEEKQEQEAEFEGRRNSSADHKTIQSIHDHCMSLGAKCSGDNAEYSSDTNSNDDDKELPTMSEETKVDFKDSPEYQALQAQFTAQQNEIERMKAEKRHSDAVAAVEELLRTGKAVPAEKAALVAAFEQAATDDAKSPMQVTFGEGQGQQGTRVDALKAVYAARPAHVLFGETVPVGSQVLLSQGASKKDEPNQERISHLKSLTPMGRASLDKN
jgi:hypothetical protein